MAMNLLLVDSDPAHGRAMQEALFTHHPSWAAVCVGTLAEARASLLQHRPDAVVVSHHLTDGSAFDLLEALEGVPALLLVREGDAMSAARGMREGFADYVMQDPQFDYVLPLPGQVVSVVDKVRLERALKENAAVSELALDAAGLGFWQLNTVTGTYTVSHRWNKRLGYAQDDEPGEDLAWRDIVHPDDMQRVQTTLAQYQSGEKSVYECEYRVRHRDGHWVWVSSRGRAVEWGPDGRPSRISGLHIDVTVRRSTDEALVRQHHMLQAISTAQNAFIADEPASAMFGGVLRALMELTGSSAGCLGEVLRSDGGEAEQVMHAVSGPLPEGLQPLLRQAIEQARPVMQPATLGPAGALPEAQRWLAWPVVNAGQVVIYVELAQRQHDEACSLLDLEPLLNTAGQLVQAWRQRLERRQAKEQLHETSELLAQKTRALEITLDSMDQGIANVDADGRVRVHNQRYLELLNLPAEWLASQPLLSDVVEMQVQRGDFGKDFCLVEPRGREYVAGRYARQGQDMPAVYLRRTVEGRVLEIRSRALPGGGHVRTFSDVTAYVESQEALRQSEARWRAMSELSSDWYWEQDEHYRFTRVEGPVQARAGIVPEVAIGKTRWELDVGNLDEAQWAEHRRQLDSREVFHDFELQRLEPGRPPRWVAISGAPVFDEQGRFKGYRGIGRDISEKKKSEAIIERLAFYDELTGLPNRRLLMVRLTQALAAADRSGRHGALVFLDLDNFKTLNDTLGHDHGDQLLSQVATRLVASVRPGDTVARLGGDEFVVILEALEADAVQATATAERLARAILAALNQPYPVGVTLHHSTPSMGVTLFCDGHITTEELLKRGDLAMYQAKAMGRNTLRFFDPGMQETVSARATLEADLRLALQRHEFSLLYQPMVDGQRRVLGVEALVRWSHPQRGTVPPDQFIGLAEETGLIHPLGRWVLQAACQQLVAWSAQPEMAGLTMSVNVSAREFHAPGFVEAVLEVLAHTGAPAQRLKLELTETVLLSDVQDTADKMARLKASGVGFSLDDFGTGYSSLAYLKRLPLDQLKIDKSFVRDVLTDASDATIASAIVALACNLGLGVVAEGVEQPGQYEFLLARGCPAFQGSLFSDAVSAQSLAKMVKNS